MLLGLSDGRLAGSFGDYTIKITNESNFNNYTNLVGHTDVINALVELDKHVLVSGSKDQTIIWWNLTSMSQIAKVDAYQGNIRKMMIIFLFKLYIFK